MCQKDTNNIAISFNALTLQLIVINFTIIISLNLKVHFIII